MKKIMFNDKYGLTQAVLEGRKTMTRKTESLSLLDGLTEDDFCFIIVDGKKQIQIYDDRTGPEIIMPRYNTGEIVAVAQSYKSIFEESLNYALPRYHWLDDHIDEKGFENKMFVKADLMPHQIRITDIKVERLQDISDEDVYKEGFRHEFVNNNWGNYANHEEAVLVYYDNIGRTKVISSRSPKEAFSFLIDKVSGNGTWESNPFCFCYEFELLK